jgi:transposase InsO family protein
MGVSERSQAQHSRSGYQVQGPIPRLIRGSGTNVIRLPPRSSNLNAYAERFVRSIKSECLNRMIFIGKVSLRRAVAEYVDHYHGERNHQGLDNRLIRAVPRSLQEVGMVHRKQRLGGMLNFARWTSAAYGRRH